MNFATFNKFRELIYEKSGIHLADGKQALLSARLGKRMRQLNIDDYGAYFEYLTQDESGQELTHMLDLVSTNVTSFFREPQHFDMLADIMQEWLSTGQRRFRIWSAACSSGEEPYSIAITILEAARDITDADMKILATDISTRILEKAQSGTYSEKSIEPVRSDLRSRYFRRLTDTDNSEPLYQVTEELAKMVVFRRLNLAFPPFPMRGPLDVIFCRNVMIYFDKSVRRRLIQEVHRLLKPGGYLFIGHSESLTGVDTNFRTIKPSVYMKE